LLLAFFLKIIYSNVVVITIDTAGNGYPAGF